MPIGEFRHMCVSWKFSEPEACGRLRSHLNIALCGVRRVKCECRRWETKDLRKPMSIAAGMQLLKAGVNQNHVQQYNSVYHQSKYA